MVHPSSFKQSMADFRRQSMAIITPRNHEIPRGESSKGLHALQLTQNTYSVVLRDQGALVLHGPRATIHRASNVNLLGVPPAPLPTLSQKSLLHPNSSCMGSSAHSKSSSQTRHKEPVSGTPSSRAKELKEIGVIEEVESVGSGSDTDTATEKTSLLSADICTPRVLPSANPLKNGDVCAESEKPSVSDGAMAPDTASHGDVNWLQTSASDRASECGDMAGMSSEEDPMEMSSPFADTKILMTPPTPKLASSHKQIGSVDFGFTKRLGKKCNSTPVPHTPTLAQITDKDKDNYSRTPPIQCPLDMGVFKRTPSHQPPAPLELPPPPQAIHTRKVHIPKLVMNRDTNIEANESATATTDDVLSPSIGIRRTVTWRRRRRTNNSSIIAGTVIPPQWEVAVDMNAFVSVDPVLTVQCISSEDIARCRRICLAKGYGGFALSSGLAHFREETGEECRLNLQEMPGVSFHIVTLWEEVRNKDAFPGEFVHEMEVGGDLEACVHECVHQGYGGFSVHNGMARFKEQRSAECREALEASPGVRFYLIKGEVGWRLKVRWVVMHPFFEKVMLAFTILNVVALGADHHGISSGGTMAINLVNIVCTFIFAIEIVVKIVGIGWVLTFRDPYNKFDAFLVIVGVPQLIVSFTGSSTGGNFLSIFKMMRVARVLRLGRRWARLRETISIVLDSLTAVVYLSLLLLLILFIYSILGMQLFGKTATGNRMEYSSLWRSLLTVFVVVTGEGWSDIMVATMTSVGWGAAIYYVSLFVIGQYIILNLFVAIIIDRFESNRDDVVARRQNADIDWVETESEDEGTSEETAVEETVGRTPTVRSPTEPCSNKERGRRVRSVFELKLQGESVDRQTSSVHPDTRISISESEQRNSSGVSTQEANEPGPVRLSPEWFGETTLCCVHYTNVLRVWLTPIVTSPLFDKIIISIIVLNLIVLAFENPYTEASFNSLFNWSDFGFTLLFVLEMAAKLMVLGAWQTPHAYLRDLWNVVDFAVVATSVLGQFVPFFHAFRSFRVFRLITRSENAKVVLYATVGAVPSVMNGLIVSFFIFILFAILGVQLFKGDLVQCNDSSINERVLCNGTYINDNGDEAERQWIWNRDANFNHVGLSLFTLFKVALSEMWVDIMLATIDSSDYDNGPSQDKRPWVSLYFVVFYIIANFLCLNLIISILISTFSIYHEARFIQSHREEDPNLYSGWEADAARFEMMRHRLLTEGQKRWVRSQQLLARDIHYTALPRTKFRKKLHKIANSTRFEWAVACVIVANLVLLASQHRNPQQLYTTIFEIVNKIFVGLYTLEFLIKVLAFTWSGYWKDGWNRFDFVVLMVSLVGTAVGENLTLFRVLRIGRVLRLFHMSKGLAKMFTALLYALPPLFNIGLLLMCVFFVFGVLGVDLFGELSLQLNPDLNRDMNFRNLPEAFLLLFQISTGESWLDAMAGCRVQPPYCHEGKCGSEVAVPYFVLFMIVVSFLMVNLFVAVVLEAFQDAEQVLNNDSLITAFNEFRREWLRLTYDLDQDNDEMDVDKFIELIKGTRPPLGPEKQNEFLLRLLKDLNIPVDTNLRVAYQDVVHALARRVFKITREEAFELSHLSHVKVTDEMFTVAHVYCVRKIGRLWREHGKKRRASKDHLPAAPFGSVTSSQGNQPIAKEASPFHAFTAFNVQHTGGANLRVPSIHYTPSMSLGEPDSNGNSKRPSVSSYVPHKRSHLSTPKTSRSPSESNLNVSYGRRNNIHVPTASDIETRLRYLDAPSPTPTHSIGTRSRSGTFNGGFNNSNVP
eukprot:TRINITY_DN10472_c0_g1_i4.p1 TRINITY_DN10472_c0_g1~~TRINITY_DN10472_c0_g1_i4.p1  ORF type:complete len:1774 (+),score=510.75 TRINITY_DN10472_c0_g1_i4:1889-7210(+)